MLKCECGSLGLRGKPADAEALAASSNCDVECCFDLAQILVQRTTKIGEARIVEGIQRDFQSLAFQDEAAVGESRVTTSPRKL